MVFHGEHREIVPGRPNREGTPGPGAVVVESAVGDQPATWEAWAVFERFTDSSRQVLVSAQEEARLLGHSFIGTEHILLGLLQHDGPAAQVLVELGASLTTARARVEATIGLAGGQGSPPFTPRAKKVLELSLREAMQLGAGSIDTEHILLGLVREGKGVGAQVLTSLGIDLSQVRQRVIQHLAGLGSQERAGTPKSFGLPADGDEYRGRVVTCSFCGLAPPASGRLVSGQNAFICENCIGEWFTRLGSRTSGHLGPRGWTSRASVDLPMGQEPDEPDRARADIRAAYIASRVPSEDGRSVPTVENGGELGATLMLANERHQGIVGDGSAVIISADEIHFYDPERAAVLFSISNGGRLLLGGQRGEAVLVDGVWKMSRSTFAQLMAMAGVACPPESG